MAASLFYCLLLKQLIHLLFRKYLFIETPVSQGWYLNFWSLTTPKLLAGHTAAAFRDNLLDFFHLADFCI